VPGEVRTVERRIPRDRTDRVPRDDGRRSGGLPVAPRPHVLIVVGASTWPTTAAPGSSSVEVGPGGRW